MSYFTFDEEEALKYFRGRHSQNQQNTAKQVHQVRRTQRSPLFDALEGFNYVTEKVTGGVTLGASNLLDKGVDWAFDRVLGEDRKKAPEHPPSKRVETIGKVGELAGGFVTGGAALKAGTTIAAPVVKRAASSLVQFAKGLPTVGKVGATAGATATGYETYLGATDPEYADRRDTFPSQFGASLRAGTGDVLDITGNVAQWRVQDALADRLTTAGENIRRGFDDAERQEFTWKSLFDPDFYAVNVARTVPMTAALVPAMFAGWKLGGGAGAKMGLGAFGRTIASAIGGTAASRPLESALEAGDVYGQMYQQELGKGKTEAEADLIADQAAQEVFNKNLALAGMDAAQLAIAFLPTGKLSGSIAKLTQTAAGRASIAAGKLAFESGTEAAEEGIQYAIQQQAMGEEVDWSSPEAKEAMAIGGLFGGVMGGAGVISDTVKTRVAVNAPPELKTQLSQNIETKLEQGLSEEEAVEQAFDDLADTPEGKQAIQQVTQEVAAELETEIQNQVKVLRNLEEVGISGGRLATGQQIQPNQPEPVFEGQQPHVEMANAQELTASIDAPESVQGRLGTAPTDNNISTAVPFTVQSDQIAPVTEQATPPIQEAFTPNIPEQITAETPLVDVPPTPAQNGPVQSELVGHAENIHSKINKFLIDEETNTYRYEVDGGYLDVIVDENTGEALIDFVAVDAPRRRQGIATSLIAAASKDYELYGKPESDSGLLLIKKLGATQEKPKAEWIDMQQPTWDGTAKETMEAEGYDPYGSWRIPQLETDIRFDGTGEGKSSTNSPTAGKETAPEQVTIQVPEKPPTGIQVGDTVYRKSNGKPLKILRINNDGTLQVENDQGNRMPVKIDDVNVKGETQPDLASKQDIGQSATKQDRIPKGQREAYSDERNSARRRLPRYTETGRSGKTDEGRSNEEETRRYMGLLSSYYERAGYVSTDDGSLFGAVPKGETRPEHQRLSSFLESIGLELFPFKLLKDINPKLDGTVCDNIVFLNIDAPASSMSIILHELTHYLKNNHSDMYQDIADAIIKGLSVGQYMEIQERYEKIGYDPTEAFDEFICDVNGHLMAEALSIEIEGAIFMPGELEELLGKTAAEEIRKAGLKAIQSLKKDSSIKRVMPEESALIDRYKGQIEEMAKKSGVNVKITTNLVERFNDQITRDMLESHGLKGNAYVAGKTTIEKDDTLLSVTVDLLANENTPITQEIVHEFAEVWTAMWKEGKPQEYQQAINFLVERGLSKSRAEEHIPEIIADYAIQGDEYIQKTVLQKVVDQFKSWVEALVKRLTYFREKVHGELPTEIKQQAEWFTQGKWDKIFADVREKSIQKQTAFSVKAMPGFYSQLQKIIEEKMPNQTHPGQVLAIIKGGQVKADELKWSGIESWLIAQKRKVSKEEVLAYLQDNQIEIKEVTKGEKPKNLRAVNLISAGLDRWEIYDGDKLLGVERANSAYEAIEKFTPIPDTKYGTYQLPGGENYRELLLILPDRDQTQRELLQQEMSAITDPAIEGERDLTNEENQRLQALRSEYNTIPKQEEYRSSHWKEPNVLAHVRFNDRTGENGEKILLLEEVQSDWHQAGREKGYSNGQMPNDWRLRETDTHWIGDSDKYGPEKIKVLKEINDSKQMAISQILSFAGVVPDAPFSKTWHELVLKRMLRFAAENGYDRLAWTTGEQQAARYDISQQVKEIKWARLPKDIYKVDVFDHNGQEVSSKKVSAPEMVDYLGKEIARQIFDSPKGNGSITGENLVVGGQGMKGFYDRMIPAFLNRYAKKWGAKVEPAYIAIDSGIDSGEDGPQPPIMERVTSLPITNAMKESVLQGQPLFSLKQWDYDPILETYKKWTAKPVFEGKVGELALSGGRKSPKGSGENIVRITGIELGEVQITKEEIRKRAREYASEHLKGKVVKNIETGYDIAIANSGIKHVISLSGDIRKVKLIVALPEIIEKSFYIGSEPKYKDNPSIKRIHRFRVEARIGNERVFVNSVVRETTEGKFFYDYRLSEIKMEPVSDTPVELSHDGSNPFRPITGPDSNITTNKEKVKAPEDVATKDHNTKQINLWIDNVVSEVDLNRLSPKAARDISESIARGLNTVLRAGKVSRRSKGAAGTFTPRAGTGNVKKQHIGSWRVMGHELGHALWHKGGFRPDKAEMVSLAEMTYPGKLPKGKESQEGLAEFLVLWFTDNQKARTVASKTGEKLDTFLDVNPQLSIAFKECQFIAEKDLEGSPLARMGSAILKPGERLKTTIGEEYQVPKHKRAAFKFMDLTIPIRDMFNAAVARGYQGIDPAKLMAIKGMAEEEALNAFESSARDKAGRFLVPNSRSLREIIDEVSNIENGLEIMDWVYHAMRYQERYERGFEVAPYPKEEINAMVEEARENYPRIVELVEEYSEILSETILRTLVRGNVISNETSDRIREGSKTYLPSFHPGKSSSPFEGGARRAAGSVVQRYKGHSDATLGFIEASLLKLHDTFEAVEINRIMNAIEETARQEDMGLFGKIVDKPQVVRMIGESNLSRQLEDFFGSQDMEDDDRVIRLFMPGNIRDVNKREPIIMSRRGDRQVFVQLAPDVYEAVIAMAPVSINVVGKFLGWMSQISRLGALLSPRYFLNAITRDVLGARIQTTTPQRSMLIGWLQGAAISAGMDKQMVNLYIQSGGYGAAAQQHLNAMLRTSINGYTKGLYNTPVPGWKRTAKGTMVRMINSPLEALRVMEEASRISEFEAVIKQRLEGIGLTLDDLKEGNVPDELAHEVEKILIDGAYASREVVTNFGLHGTSESFRKYARTVTFLQGGIQGVYREYRMMKDKPAQTMKRWAAYMLPITLIAWALSHDDDRYRDMPSDTRDMYWWFPAGPYYFALAKPYGYALPSSMLERFLDWSANQEDPTRRKPLEHVVEAIRQSFSFPVMSILVSTTLQLMTNTNHFGSPIVPMREENLSPKLRYGPETSNAAIKAAEMLAGLMGDKGPSPRQIDYFMKGNFGNLGDALMSLLSLPLDGPGSQRKAGTEYMPFVGRFLYGPMEGGSRVTDRFYQDKDRALMIRNDIKQYEKQGMTVEQIVEKVGPDKIRLALAYPALNNVSETLSDLRSELREIERNPDIPAQHKRIARLRVNYISTVMIGSLYGRPIPEPPPELEWDENEIQGIVDQVN